MKTVPSIQSQAGRALAAVVALAAAFTFGLAPHRAAAADGDGPPPVTVKVGSPAPKLRPGKFVQGEPVKEFEKGKAYIVEFWATWCGPCRTSIPHLNEIHQRFRDRGLVVIGQDVWERDESLVEPFVKKMGTNMTYRVALDDKSGPDKEKGAMAAGWMEAAGQNGIPSAFLIDTQGRVAWIGHPMTLKDEVVQSVIEGKYDLAKAAADYEKRQGNEEALEKAYRALAQSMRAKDWDAASARLDDLLKVAEPEMADNLVGVRFDILIGKKDEAGAYRLASETSDRRKDDAMIQNEMAWRILTDPAITKRDVPLAEKIARRATEASKGKDPASLDTLARALFMGGKKTEAIELQQKAIGLLDEGSDIRKEFEATLAAYKEGKLPGGE